MRTSWTRTVLRTALLTGALVAPTVLGGAASAADQTTSWQVRTSVSQFGTSRAAFTYTARPGQDITDGIDIANQGAAPLTLQVYAADGFTTAAGGLDVLTPEKRSTDIGAWVTPAVRRITVPPRAEVQVPVTLRVPAGATPGDHTGGIVTVLDQGSRTQGGTVVHQRVGLRLKVRVSGTLTPQLRLEDVRLHYAGGSDPFGTGQVSVSYTVHNTGNVALGGTQSVRLSGALGVHARTVQLPRLASLLPGERRVVRAPLGRLHALLWVDGAVTLRPVVTDAAGSTAYLAPVTGSARDLVSPWSWVVLFGGVLLLGVLVWLGVVGGRRWRRSTRARDEAKVAAAVEDALREMKVRQ